MIFAPWNMQDIWRVYIHVQVGSVVTVVAGHRPSRADGRIPSLCTCTILPLCFFPGTLGKELLVLLAHLSALCALSWWGRGRGEGGSGSGCTLLDCSVAGVHVSCTISSSLTHSHTHTHTDTHTHTHRHTHTHTHTHARTHTHTCARQASLQFLQCWSQMETVSSTR